MRSVSVADLWQTYNRSAATYRSVRPDYPIEVFDAIESYAELPTEPRVLEIGVGTGQATRQLAQRGWDLVGLEPGADLAALARRDVAGFPHVEIQTCSFEAAVIPDHSFDLIAAATAWHWIDPASVIERPPPSCGTPGQSRCGGTRMCPIPPTRAGRQYAPYTKTLRPN
jgi:SAM-dependent methyltransferase